MGSRERLIVQQALSSIIGPGEIRIVLWFGQAGVLVGADLSGVTASSEDKTRLLIELCDRFASANEGLAGKTVIFSYKLNDLLLPQTHPTEMAPPPPKPAKPGQNM